MMLRATAVNLSANVLAAAFSALALYFAVQSLSVHDWGMSAALLGIGQFLGGLFSFGTQIKLLRDLSTLGYEEYRLRAPSVSCARLLSGSCVGAIGLLVWAVHPPSGVVLFLAGGVFVSLGALMPLLGARQYALAGLLLVIEKVACLAITALTLPLLDVFALPMAFGSSGYLAGLLVSGTLIVRSRGVSVSRTKHELREQWRGSLSFGSASVAPSALLLDVTIITALAGSVAAGVYSIGSKLVAPLSVAATTLVQVLMPRMSASRPRGLTGFSRRALFGFAIGFLLFCVLGVIAVPVVVESLLGPRYAQSTGPIRVFVLNAAVVLLTRTLVTALQAWGKEALAAKLVASQVVIALLGIAGLCGYGPTAAAIAVLGSNLVLTGALAIAVARTIRTSARGDQSSAP